ncbi:MAG: DUF72 domain-containing protein [Nitrososphaeria archaeon]
MKIHVGTSGYSYPWNEGKPDPLSWYISKGFDTVELNSTFYSFPRRPMITRWSKAERGFFYSVKVYKGVTHYTKLSSVPLFNRFYNTFESMRGMIRAWLFQMPPSFGCSEKNLRKLDEFIRSVSLEGIPVIEFRDPCWWEQKREVSELGYVFCSVSAPELPNELVVSNGIIYLRMHGRTEWYAYEYSEEELKEYFLRIKESGAGEAYVYFNNDLGMLENALFFRALVKKS